MQDETPQILQQEELDESTIADIEKVIIFIFFMIITS